MGKNFAAEAGRNAKKKNPNSFQVMYSSTGIYFSAETTMYLRHLLQSSRNSSEGTLISQHTHTPP